MAKWCTWAAVLLMATACGFDGAVGVSSDASGAGGDGASGDGASGGDGGSSQDGSTTNMLCGYPFAPAHFDPCADPLPSADLTLAVGPYLYNTDTGVLAPSATTPLSSVVNGVRVVWTDDFALTLATLRVEGSLPLMIVAKNTIEITGSIDVSSRYDGSTFELGAGASLSATTCANPPEAGVKCNNHGASGGGGGGFGSAGSGGDHGAAARDCGDGENGRPPTAGGESAPVPSKIRAGCAGAPGSDTNHGTAGGQGLGGPGGGAIHLYGGQAITITGVIEAGGAAGGPATKDRSSGGGAGSGGYIGLESKDITISVTGVLAANGGGGGGGCDNATAFIGDNAWPAEIVASGGLQDDNGSPGNDGAFGSTAAEPATNTGDRGGGGGGGGVGYILFHNHGTVSIDGLAVITPQRTDI